MYEGNYAKMTQHTESFNELKRTMKTIIVEASPEDPIWGIGMHESNKDILNMSKWKGTNWLGMAIMEVRDKLIEEGKL